MQRKHPSPQQQPASAQSRADLDILLEAAGIITGGLSVSAQSRAEDDLIIPTEAALALRVSNRTFATIMAKGDIEVCRIGRSVRITRAALRDYIAAHSCRNRPARRTKPPVKVSKKTGAES